MFVKPREGAVIRDNVPPYAPIPATGRRVPVDVYWHTLLRDGDVVLVESVTPTPTPTAPIAGPAYEPEHADEHEEPHAAD